MGQGVATATQHEAVLPFQVQGRCITIQIKIWGISIVVNELNRILSYGNYHL